MLIMIGFVMIDPLGSERLRKILQNRRPKIIGIERSPDESVEDEIKEMVTESIRILLSKMLADYNEESRKNAEQVFSKIKENIGFDEDIVREYAEEYNAEVVPLENSIERFVFISEMHKRARRLAGVKEGSRALEFSIEQFQKSIDDTYYNESLVLRALMMEPPLRKRSEYMAKRVIAKGCDATVTGFAHTVDFPGTLYRFLRSRSPERIPLPRGDAL
jgi:hypothetical protein